MDDREFRVGDRVKLDPATAAMWRRFAETGRAATVIAVYTGENIMSPMSGGIVIRFDGKFKYPERGCARTSDLLLIEPATETDHG